jgi:hypothetical protein
LLELFKGIGRHGHKISMVTDLLLNVLLAVGALWTG